MKHNKKRNTAFIYEVLARELTKAVVNKNTNRKELIVGILKENFTSGTILAKELKFYRNLTETKNLSTTLAERMLTETKVARKSIADKELFGAQSRVISAINKALGKNVWSNFVPNFKTLASIKSIFDMNSPVKQRVLFEQALIDNMTSSLQESPKDLKSIDSLTYSSFINKFNDKYGSLLSEQKNFLNKYITSFADDGFELRVYLNEEITRLRTEIGTSSGADSINSVTRRKSESIVEYLDEFRRREFEPTDLTKILKMQELVKELNTND